MIIVENSLTKFNEIQKTRKNCRLSFDLNVRKMISSSSFFRLCSSMIDSKRTQFFHLPTISNLLRHTVGSVS